MKNDCCKCLKLTFKIRILEQEDCNAQPNMFKEIVSLKIKLKIDDGFHFHFKSTVFYRIYDSMWSIALGTFN